MIKSKYTNQLLLWMIGLGLFTPLFFRLDGSVYADVKILAESGGVVALLPLPISIPVCLAALLFLMPGIFSARPALLLIAGTMACGFISLALGADGITGQQRKLLMLAQVLMPMAGIVLGQLIRDERNIIARAFLLILCFVVPLQLVLTWVQEKDMLTHYFNIFSIYSHIQFVTLIFVCAFVYVATNLWGDFRWQIVALAALMFLYVSRSYSFLTISAYVLAVTVFSLVKFAQLCVSRKSLLTVIALIVSLVAASALYTSLGSSQLFMGKFTDVMNGQIPPNVQERFDDWKLFGSGIVESPKTIAFGHAEPMPREIRSSPHNWYVEQVYTFGLVILLPIVSLMLYTARLCFIDRKNISSQTLWLAGIVFYLVVVDSNFKVTLRQPYPGIFAYFMWGMLLTRLRDSSKWDATQKSRSTFA